MTTLKISLAAARVNAGLTQKEVAERLKISNKTLINWETGATEPSFASLQCLADLYQIPMDNIFLPIFFVHIFDFFTNR